MQPPSGSIHVLLRNGEDLPPLATAGHATEKSCEKIKNAERSLEDIQVSDLMEVLRAVGGSNGPAFVSGDT